MSHKPLTVKVGVPPADVDELRRCMAQWPDADLINVLTLDRAIHTPVALDVADEELKRRSVALPATAVAARQLGPLATLAGAISNLLLIMFALIAGGVLVWLITELPIWDSGPFAAVWRWFPSAGGWFWRMYWGFFVVAVAVGELLWVLERLGARRRRKALPPDNHERQS